MTMASYINIFCILAVFSVLVSKTKCQTFRVSEGQDGRLFIGSVTQSTELQESIKTLNLNLSLLQYTIFSADKSPAKYFLIDQSTGGMFTNGVLDRETLCNPEEVTCSVTLDVSAHTKDGFLRIFNVEVIIDDINDNPPVFPKDLVVIQVSEAEPINSTITFRGATDADSIGVNSQLSYELVTRGSPFELRVISYPDRTQDVGLVVARKLNREDVPSYQLEIVARDAGDQQRTGTVIVDVSITDVNDNFPEFTKDIYSVTISEDLPINTPVIQVRALDSDFGKNGKVTYKLSTETKAFVINATSGYVLVGENMDFEQKQVYKLLVEASDNGDVPKTNKVVVTVNVSDVNDNAPEINFNFIPVGTEAMILEHSPMDTFVAYMSVSDKDQGVNAVVLCNVEGSRYSLEIQKLNEYIVKLQTELDRESLGEDNVHVVCVDSGTPSLSTTSSFKVLVQDINDNAPILPKSEYSLTIKEGLDIGTLILNVSASDKDFGENGRLTYSLEGQGADMFSVSDQGEVRVVLKPDRENQDHLELTLMVKDNGNSQKSSAAELSVNITDINDESPEFSKLEYRFNITENLEGEMEVGSVFAEDPDLGVGGQVVYRLSSNYDSQFFRISQDTGIIFATQSLNREERAMRELNVICEDQGTPSLSSSVNVFIKILDVNDNTPKIIFPESDNYSVSIPSSLPVRSEVITVTAHDKDDGKNAELNYALIEEEKSSEYFSIEPTTGVVTLAKEIKLLATKTYRLSLAVRDNGTPQRETIRKFNVQVRVLNETAVMAQTEPGQHNLVIVISVIAMTAVLSAIILATICIIRRRDKKPSEASNVRPDLYDQPPVKKTEHKTSNVGEIVRKDKLYEAQVVPVHKVHPIPNYEAPLQSSSPKDLPPYTIQQDSKNLEHQHLQYIREFFPNDTLDLSSVSTADQSQYSRPNSRNRRDQQKLQSSLKYPPYITDEQRRLSQRQSKSSKKNSRPNRVQWALEPAHGDENWNSKGSVYGIQIPTDGDKFFSKPDDSTSDLSGDTATSDSGRGGSDDDVHRGCILQIENEGVHGHYV